MADYSQHVDQLVTAAAICQRHTIVTSVNGIQPHYPRWPEAWAACEVVWRNYLDMRTMDEPGAETDRRTVIDEADRLR